MEYYLNYSPVGDYATMAIIIVFFFIFKSSIYSQSSKHFWLRIGLSCLMVASLFNVTYMTIIQRNVFFIPILIYVLRDIANILLMVCLAIFSRYLLDMFERSKKVKKISIIYNIVVLIITSIFIILSPITHYGFYISSGQINGNFFPEPFSVGYLLYIFELFLQLIRYRRVIIKRAYIAIWGVFIIAEGIMLCESISSSSTLVCFTYLLPVLEIFALFHSTSYDLETGTLDNFALDQFIRNNHKKNKDYVIISLNFVGIRDIDSFIKRIRNELHHFYEDFFYKAYTFRVTDRRFVLICDGLKGKNEAEINEKFKKEFIKLYDKYQMKFKLIGTQSNSYFKDYNTYFDYIKYLETKMGENELKKVSTKELSEYMTYLSILDELKKIDYKKDLNDERVLVYTQPIYDTKTKKIKTAESLMRLKLNDEIIYPDKFIPIAEANNLIHTLSLIILNKVCSNIKKINKEYELERISVNFSTVELTNSNFAKEVKNIIIKNKIPFESIGIEITESQTISASKEIVESVKKLSDLGIKMYLDDFGTGYSNFERIMKIPFDIIKFDKSLLDSSKVDDSFKIMTKNFSKTYHDLGYKILFEGVETEADSKMCKSELNANYLQGFFYSRPIPIENLHTYLSKKTKN